MTTENKNLNITNFKQFEKKYRTNKTLIIWFSIMVGVSGYCVLVSLGGFINIFISPSPNGLSGWTWLIVLTILAIGWFVTVTTFLAIFLSTRFKLRHNYATFYTVLVSSNKLKKQLTAQGVKRKREEDEAMM
ncbi:MAG: hypothetical protein LBT17_00220 [Mycoplasmataceae bacterium]|jgi:hypothetical protein|nr:hypothetical protein [Mycoplasmataceae bacterium]